MEYIIIIIVCRNRCSQQIKGRWTLAYEVQIESETIQHAPLPVRCWTAVPRPRCLAIFHWPFETVYQIEVLAFRSETFFFSDRRICKTLMRVSRGLACSHSRKGGSGGQRYSSCSLPVCLCQIQLLFSSSLFGLCQGYRSPDTDVFWSCWHASLIL